MLKRLNKIKVGTILKFGNRECTVLEIIDNSLFQSLHSTLGTVQLMYLDSVEIRTDFKTYNVYEILEAEYD